MLKSKTTTIDANVTSLIAANTVTIGAASFVYENNWINFGGTIFNAPDYITSVVVSPRTRFFINRNYAVQLIVGLTKDGETTVIEGTQVDFTKQTVVPVPEIFDVIPLVGILLIQDGTTDLVYGFKPLDSNTVTFFSGTGNVTDSNKLGDPGPDSNDFGHTGAQGLTGNLGVYGDTGYIGVTGYKGVLVPGDNGDTGIHGITGISWAIHIPFIQSR